MKRFTIPAALATLALAACSSGSSHHAAAPKTPATISVRGQLILSDMPSRIASLGQSTCSGSGGYADLTAGAQVVISDDAGKTLTITRLDDGEPSSADDPEGRCTFPFSGTVPAGKGFYSITVTHRGAVKFSELDMTAIPTVTIG